MMNLPMIFRCLVMTIMTITGAATTPFMTALQYNFFLLAARDRPAKTLQRSTHGGACSQPRRHQREERQRRVHRAGRRRASGCLSV
jgi:hypothetical protein